MAEPNVISALLERDASQVLTDWLAEQQEALVRRRDLINDAELRQQSERFLSALASVARAIAPAELGDVQAPAWNGMRALLGDLSRSRAKQGFSPSETASFVFSLRMPLLTRLQAQLGGAELVQESLNVTLLLDKLGLYTIEVFQTAREEVIARQQAEMLELSTPVVQLWDGILALPLIGTLDSRRTQTVMETLLRRIVETGSEFAIIDITGVPTVDTLTAQHLIKTITAARLMGADCIISGIRPQIAQTIVHLGVNLGDVLTKSSLAGALSLALKRRGMGVVKLSAVRAAGHANQP